MFAAASRGAARSVPCQVRCGGSTERCDAVQCSAMPRKAHRRRREDSGALRQFTIISLRGQWLLGGGGGGGRRLTNLNVFALVVVGHGHVGSIYTMVEKGRWGLLYVSGLYRVCTSIQQYATRSNTTVPGLATPAPESNVMIFALSSHVCSVLYYLDKEGAVLVFTQVAGGLGLAFILL